jgi:transcriptional regulator with XRE-family HTH domain
MDLTVGQKIAAYKENLGFKNYAEFGKAAGLSGDWLNDLSKKDTLQTVDITRLIKLTEYLNITLDDLLKDNNECIIDTPVDLPENDIYKLLIDIQNRLQDDGNTFNGTAMNDITVKLVSDSIDIIYKLVKANN